MGGEARHRNSTVTKYTAIVNAHAKTLDILDRGEILAKISDWKYRSGRLLTGVIVSPIPGWNGEDGTYSDLLDVLRTSGQSPQIYTVCHGSSWAHFCGFDDYSLYRTHGYHCLFGNGRTRRCICYKMIAVSKYCSELNRSGTGRSIPVNLPLRYRAAMIYGNLGVPSRHDLRHKL